MFRAGDTETVTVVRPPARDTFGDALPGTEASTDLPGCLVAPGGSGEQNSGANQVTTDATVYAPPGADILATDRLLVRGQLHEVVGQPQQWTGYGLVIDVRRITG